jgi:hypothetical protein
LDEFEKAIPPGSRPLYVSTVKYGMMAYVCVESQYSYEVISAAVDASYNGEFDLDIHAGFTAEEIMRQSSIQIVVYGGSTLGLDNLETGFEGFLNVIEASRDFDKDSPGVPLVYKFRHLIDNTLALVTLTSQYTLIGNPVQLQQPVRITVERYVCTMADDEGVNNNPDMDRFYAWANAYNCVAPGNCNQFNVLDQEIYGWATSDDVTMGVGDIHWANKSIVLTFDTYNYDFAYAKLKLKAYARDWDPTGSNETATSEIELTGNDMFGPKEIWLYSSDFTFRVDLNIEAIQD